MATTSALVVDGVDVVAEKFVRKAATARPGASAVVVKHAALAAQRMRNRVPIDEGDLLESITADDAATLTPLGAYADAGPDSAANPKAFVGPLIERGTVKMEPQPFVGPAGDETIPGFERDMKILVGR